MYKCSILLQFILLLTCTSALAQESETKKKLIGNWIYSGLEYKGPINEETMQEMEKANKQNKNLVVTFNTDGSYLIWNKIEGKNEPYAEGKVELTRKGKHLKIEGLEGDIEQLDTEVLKLSAPEKPLMVFKKYEPKLKS